MMNQHFRTLGIAHIVYSVMLIVPAVIVYVVLTSIGYFANDPDAEKILPIIGMVVGIVLVVLAIPGLIAGFGLLAKKSWALAFSLVIGVLNIFCIPFGTALGVYSIWVFIKDHDARKTVATE